MFWIFATLFLRVQSLQLPNSCASDQYYDSTSLSCQTCSANSSLVRSSDGFSCICDENSIPTSASQCRTCSATEMVSSDGTTCVKRKCQNVAGRVACRKCPADYISVTLNFDGSPMKEVQCIKCARGYKPVGNTCVRCEACACTRAQLVVRGICVPKSYANDRPNYVEKVLHPLDLLDVVKYEYLCTKNDSRMCHALANECVQNFYTSDLGGPCRLWLQPKLTPKGLPPLLVNDKSPDMMSLPRKKFQGTISLAVAIFSSSGGMRFLYDPNRKNEPCWLPLKVNLGNDVTVTCNLNLSKLTESELQETLAPYVATGDNWKPLPVTLVKPSGYILQRGSWPNDTFSRYFLAHRSLSTATNSTNTVYLKTMSIKLSVQRNSTANGSLKLQISMEAQYGSTDHLDSVSTTLKVEYDLPNAGIVRGLEICGGVLGTFLCLYALVQWRGVLRRGGPHYSLIPLLAGTAADVIYFSALLTTVHALTAEAGTLSMTLPLSKPEENIIRNLLFVAFSIKVIKIAWINWKQCTCDILFINWSEYNPPAIKDSSSNDSWKLSTLAREWSSMQTMRKASPGFTVFGTLLLLNFINPWQSLFPQSRAYSWAVTSMAWWSSYGIVLATSLLLQKFLVSPVKALPRICTNLGISLMVFQEEFYAHYVHGRNDDFQEVRSMAGPLATCRVACVPQLRAVCRQLSSPGPGIVLDTDSKQSLLSKFMAAFFERALDGLNWVASERTTLERLLDVEVTSREAGTTSTLLYDDDTTPSCFNMTWWGEEWNLSTFDAMLFSCVFIASGDAILAALVTVSTWQILKQLRTWCGIEIKC